MKQKPIFILFISLIVVLMSITISRTNFDHIGQGTLQSVEIMEPPCPYQCFRATIDFVTTDPKVMEELKTIFFGKVSTNLLSYPEEEGIFTVIFTFENETIKFNLNMDRLSSNGVIKYEPKKAVYQMTYKETETIQKLLYVGFGS
jgi:hypothetical protein